MHHNFGLAFAAQDKWNEAQDEFRAALAIDPYCGAAHNSLARHLTTERHEGLTLRSTGCPS